MKNIFQFVDLISLSVDSEKLKVCHSYPKSIFLCHCRMQFANFSFLPAQKKLHCCKTSGMGIMKSYSLLALHFPLHLTKNVIAEKYWLTIKCLLRFKSRIAIPHRVLKDTKKTFYHFNADRFSIKEV